MTPALLACDIELRTAAPRRQAPLKARPIQQWIFPDGTPWASFHRTRAGYSVRFPGYADYVVSPLGDRVLCRPVPGVSAASLEHIYANQVLPLALGRAGHLVFHASAVDLDGRCVAFMGASGRGKSTLAASFACSGRRFLTDDGLVVVERRSRAVVVPSAPSLRLWDDSSVAVLASVDARTSPAPYSAKVHFHAGRGIAHRSRALALHHVYFLGEGGARGVAIDAVPKGEALIELVRHSFLIDVEAEEVLATHFAGLARLTRRCEFFRLDYPRRFAELARVREAIVAHAMESA